MFGFGKRGKGQQKVIIESMDDIRRLHAQNQKSFMKLIPQYAEEGNTVCQKFLAQASLVMLGEKTDPAEISELQDRYFKFGTMLAEQGDVEEQFNLGIQYVRQVNAEKDMLYEQDILNGADAKNIQVAAFWIRKSANSGFEPALEIVDGIVALAERRHAFRDKSGNSVSERDANDSNDSQIEIHRIAQVIAPTNIGDTKAVLRKIGFEDAVQYYTHLVRMTIPDERVWWQFILEELDAANDGNAKAQAFVQQSDIPEHLYKGALDRSFPEVDGPNGPQQTIIRIAGQLIEEADLMVELRTSIVRNIIKDYSIPT